MKETNLIVLLSALIIFSGCGLALQPSGNVKIYDIGDIGTILANESPLVLNDTDFSVYQAPSYVKLPLTITEIEPGVFNITANVSIIISYTNSSTTDVLLLTYDYPGNNSGMIRINSVSDNSTYADCSINSDDGNIVDIVCADWTISEGDEIFTINIILEWNATISDLATYQLTTEPVISLSNNLSIDYVQNFTIKAPFSQNISINITLPEENVTLTQLTGNDTVAERSGAYIWFKIYNVDTSGVSPQVYIKADQIVYLVTQQFKTQGDAITGKNVTWTTQYTVNYNTTHFSALNVENVILNHTLWPDSDIWESNITVTENQPTSLTISGIQGKFDGGYISIKYDIFNSTQGNSSSTITIVEWTPAPTVSIPYYKQFIAFVNEPVWWEVVFYVNNTALEDYKNVLVMANANGTGCYGTPCSPLTVNTTPLNVLEGSNQTGIKKSGSSLNWTITTLSSQTINTIYKFNFTTEAPSKVEKVLGIINKGGIIWQKEVNVTNPIKEAPYLIFLNTTFRSLKLDGLYINASNITQNIEWYDVDGDTYYEKVQWNYTIPVNTTLKFIVNGTRWAVSSITADVLKIYEDGSITIDGKANYMDNDPFPFAVIHIYRYDTPYRIINVSVNATGAFSTKISGFKPGVYYIWVECFDNESVTVKSNQLSLFVYLKPKVTRSYLTPPNEIEFKILAIGPNLPKILYVSGVDVGFTKLKINVNKQLFDVRINIKTITTLPTHVPPLKNVYKYIQITKQNITDEDVSTIIFEFKVPKSWLEGNDPNSVVLQRFDGNEWRVLPTKVISKDNMYVYYEAISPGLSLFAITFAPAPTPEEKPPEKVEEKKCPTCPPCTEWSKCIDGEQTRTCYKCDETTNYECVPYEEKRKCEVEKPKEEKIPEEVVEEKPKEEKKVPIMWIIGGIITVIIIYFGYRKLKTYL